MAPYYASRIDLLGKDTHEDEYFEYDGHYHDAVAGLIRKGYNIDDARRQARTARRGGNPARREETEEERLTRIESELADREAAVQRREQKLDELADELADREMELLEREDEAVRPMLEQHIAVLEERYEASREENTRMVQYRAEALAQDIVDRRHTAAALVRRSRNRRSMRICSCCGHVNHQQKEK